MGKAREWLGENGREWQHYVSHYPPTVR